MMVANQDEDRNERTLERALRVLDFHIKYCSLRIEERRATTTTTTTTQNYAIHHKEAAAKIYLLTTTSPFVNLKQLLDDVSRGGRCAIWWSSVCLARLLIICHFWLLATIHYRFDRLRDNLWPARLSTIQASLVCWCCNRSEPINRSADYESYIKLEDWIYYVGSLMPGLRGVSTISYVLAASTCVCNDILTPTVMHFHKQRVDIYGFIRDKQGERIRFASNMRALVNDLFVCEPIRRRRGKTVVEYRARGRSEDRYHYLATYFRQIRSERRRNSALLLNQSTALASDSFTIPSGQKLYDFTMPPAHLSDGWHEKVCFICANLTRIGFIMIAMIGSCFLIASFVMEIGRRVDYRLKSFDCLARNQSISRGHSPPIRLAKLETEAQIKAYRAHDGSVANSIALFLLEAKLYLTWKEMVTSLEVLALLAGSSITLPLYTGLYLGQYISKMLWLAEIRAQISGCISGLTRVQVDDRVKLSLDDEQRNELIRALTVAYLNFELFRREQRSYQSMANFLLGQMTLMNAQSLLISYLVGSVLDRADDRMSMLLTTYVFSLLNVYLVTSAIRTSMALKLMKDISRMVAFVAGRSLQCSFVATLWAQQMLTRQETLDCFAPKLLGLSITFDKIVTLNAYLVGLWYLALRA